MLLFMTKGSQDWHSSRLGSRSWCRGNGGIFLTGLLSLLSYRTQDSGWHHPQWALPLWSLIEKMTHSWISWKHFPNWSSFLCDNSSLCQVDTQIQPVQWQPLGGHCPEITQGIICRPTCLPPPLWLFARFHGSWPNNTSWRNMFCKFSFADILLIFVRIILINSS